MTKNEAARLMATLAAAFAHDLKTDELAVWYQSALERVDPFVGGMAVQRIIAEDKFWPAPARFNEMRRLVERGQAEPVKALNEGPRAQHDRDNVTRVVATMRETIAAQNGRAHWHGGPNPCPVCGGMTSDPKALAKSAARLSRTKDEWMENSK